MGDLREKPITRMMTIHEKHTIAPAGAWNQWPEEIKNEFEQNEINGISLDVGEKLVFQNDRFRVWTIHLEPNKSLPFHRHQTPYFWTVLTSGKTRSYYGDGSITERVYEVGDTVHFEKLSEQQSFAHNLENIGDTMLIFTTVEYLF